ncbi:hypothetical protein H9635_03405 [Solibacillus sp. A46]|uniref:PCZ2.2 n=2 Tax=Solibacillus faecavium TaxID=2762221 RepID=A0ABR8XV14_9BACL|nr:hypothetical protein [Solibacillus faecavium]
MMETLVPLSLIGIPLFSIVLCVNIISLLKIIIHHPEQSVKKQTFIISVSVAYILFSFACLFIAIADSILWASN